MLKEPAILIASNNAGKAVEMRALFEAYAHRPFRLVAPDEVGIRLDVAEDGQTYPENAALKARAFCRASGLIALADDTGLEVEALDGRPGLYSARYTGNGVPAAAGHRLSDAERRQALLKELGSFPRPWKARFCCAAAVAMPDGSVLVAEGTCSGEIVPEERGEFGFGYDAIFRMSDPAYRGLTMAELSLEQKNRVSHRAEAVRKAIGLIEKLIEG